jgi:hypothetical protein
VSLLGFPHLRVFADFGAMLRSLSRVKTALPGRPPLLSLFIVPAVVALMRRPR